MPFSSRLNSENAWLPVYVGVRLHEEIIPLMNKTLSNFPYLFFRSVAILEQLYVFAPSYLFFLLNSFIILHKTNFIRINEGVILTELPQQVDVVWRVATRQQESLVKLKELAFNVFRHVYIMIAHVRDKEEFFDVS